jgi:uncharacterized membrane protein
MLSYNRKNIEVKSLVKIYFYFNGQGTWTRIDAMDKNGHRWTRFYGQDGHVQQVTSLDLSILVHVHENE